MHLRKCKQALTRICVLGGQAKRDRSTRVAKPPAGPKRSAVGPPPARAVSTDVDDDFDDHSAEAEAEIGSWGDTHMEDRDAKKQLRKEKNRASAAASRARREAYTACLEEEVRHPMFLQFKKSRSRKVLMRSSGSKHLKGDLSLLSRGSLRLKGSSRLLAAGLNHKQLLHSTSSWEALLIICDCPSAGSKTQGGKELVGRPSECAGPCNANGSACQGTNTPLEYLMFYNLLSVKGSWQGFIDAIMGSFSVPIFFWTDLAPLFLQSLLF